MHSDSHARTPKCADAHLQPAHLLGEKSLLLLQQPHVANVHLIPIMSILQRCLQAAS